MIALDLRSLARLTVAVLLLQGCAAPPDESGDHDPSEVEEVQNALTTYSTCSALTLTPGPIPSGQSRTALAIKDQSGTADTWSKYIEFAPRSQAVCTFPATTTNLSGLKVRVNYRGPTKAEMRWQFHAWDFTNSTSPWVYIGDNAFAADWVWTAKDLALPAPLNRFISGGQVRIRYSTGSSVDASQLDHWVLQQTTSDTTPPPPPPPPPGIWRPTPGTSWQWQLSETINTNVAVQMYDIDLFEAPDSVISTLHAAGRKVICYFSAGSWEPGRPDSSQFPASALGNQMKGWPEERWLDTRNATVRSIMKARLDEAVRRKCDGVEPDNVDAYDGNDPGFPLTFDTQLNYNRFLATEAHARGLSIGLKNDVEQLSLLANDFDWALNEECVVHSECGGYSAFTSKNKAVFHVEYRTSCPAPSSSRTGFSTILKNLDLDAWRVACP